MAVDTRAEGLKQASENLVRVTQELQKFNESTGVEVAKIAGKELKKVSDPFVNSIMSIPGVAMLGDVGKTLGNKLFAKMKEKREMEHLRQMINNNVQGVKLSKQEFEQLKLQENVLKAQKEETEKMTEAMKSILGFGDETQVGNLEVQNGLSELSKQAENQVNILRKNNEDGGMTAAEAEIENNRQRAEDEKTSIFNRIAGGIEGMEKSIINGLAGLKDKGLMGLGVLAGLVAAPFIAIKSFFISLGGEVKALDRIMKGGLSRFFSPFTKFFNAIGDVFSKGGTGRFLKGDTMKFFGRFTDDIVNLVGRVKGFLKPIADLAGRVKGIFKPLMSAAKGSASFMSGFAPIAKFAATFGRVLGKLFFPITILMGIFDFVTGFIRGFKEDGIIGGIKEGFIGLVDGLVGGLIRMVTGALSWILELIGLDKFAASLTDSVNGAIEGVYDIFRGVIDVITFPFRLIFEMVKGIFGGETDFGGLFGGLGDSIMGIFSGLTDIITAPFNMIYGLVQDIFSFFGFELPDFDLGQLIKDGIAAAINFVKDKVKGLFSFFGFGGDDAEEEVAKAAEKEEKLKRAGAVSTDGTAMSTVRNNGILNVAESEASLTDAGFQVASPEQRAALEEAAAARTAAAEQALQDFINAPKLSDAIGAVKEKMSAVFSGIATAVTSGFTAAKDWVVGLFTFSDEDASVAGIATKLIDIVFAPYNLAINFLRGIFGFGEDEQGNVAPFSLGEMIVGVVTDIIDFFKGLFDIDIMGLVKSIPGAGKILSFFGFGDDEQKVEPTASNDNTPTEESTDPALLARKINRLDKREEKLLADIEKTELRLQAGKFGKRIDGKFVRGTGMSNKDEKLRIIKLEEKLEELRNAREDMQQQVQVINNNNVVNAQRTSNASTTTIAPLRDTSPPAGTVPAL